MSNRHNFYIKETVATGTMNDVQGYAEKGDAHGLDAFSLGSLPIKGLTPSGDGATLVMGVSAGTGIAADADGDARLVRLLADGTINLTGALPVGASRWCLVG